ncbi:MAG TPA: hypothetical protein VLM85_09570 [Polyangiaceae bacterium]|nr:hypothetical protein [Polyangiaceae bacterium]
MSLDRRSDNLVVLAALLTAAGCGARTYLGHGGDGGGAVETGDASWIPCGDASCEPTAEYCKRVVGGPPPGVDVRSCQALPSGCHSCDCVIAPGCTCIDDTGQISLTCDAP